jgi:hypothetical protein
MKKVFLILLTILSYTPLFAMQSKIDGLTIEQEGNVLKIDFDTKLCTEQIISILKNLGEKKADTKELAIACKEKDLKTIIDSCKRYFSTVPITKLVVWEPPNEQLYDIIPKTVIHLIIVYPKEITPSGMEKIPKTVQTLTIQKSTDTQDYTALFTTKKRQKYQSKIE